MRDHFSRPVPGGGVLGPLDSADAAFRLLAAGPRPLALSPAALAAGLPDRLVPVDELRVLLLHPATSGLAGNQVWAELVRRARPGDPAWTSPSPAWRCPGCTEPPACWPGSTRATRRTCRPRS
jgi:hypothetical protein